MKVGITFSSFDLLDSNHVMILKEAKNECDYLIVGLKLDPLSHKSNKNVSTQSIIERYIHLKESKYVDEIVPYVTDQDVDDVLRSFQIDICIIGEDYKTIDFIGKEYCKEKGIEIHYNSKEHCL